MQQVIDGFGDEWTRFDQSDLPESELQKLFDEYFINFPFDRLPAGAIGFDAGCGSGRWAKLVMRRARLLLIDASPEALAVARRATGGAAKYLLASVESLPIESNRFDFGYSLGVLHHVEETEKALGECVRILKPGAPFLLYLYYDLDNRPGWFRGLWHATDFVRRGVSRLPPALRFGASQLLAAGVYYPLAGFARLAENFMNAERLPLAAYRCRPFYVMRNDALDRFGTRLEKRYTRAEMQRMMEKCGLERISFNENQPFWTAIGYKASTPNE